MNQVILQDPQLSQCPPCLNVGTQSDLTIGSELFCQGALIASSQQSKSSSSQVITFTHVCCLRHYVSGLLIISLATPSSSAFGGGSANVSANVPVSGTLSIDGTCGASHSGITCGNWPRGNCCSMYGYCGAG